MDNEFGTLKNLMADNDLAGAGTVQPLPTGDGILQWLRCLLDACSSGCEIGCSPGCKNGDFSG